MDSRILHIACTKALASVSWEKHGEHEYVLVGDGVVGDRVMVDEPVLQSLINSTFSATTLWLSVSRHEAASVPKEHAARFMAAQVAPQSTVILTDPDVHTFVELSFLGVARTGTARANYSFQRTRCARR